MAESTLSGEVPDEVPDPRRRKVLVRATATAGGLGLAAAAYPFLASLAPSERAKALGAPVEVDVARLASGAIETVEWRGKPVWILHRTDQMLASLKSDEGLLLDPDSKRASQQPEYAQNRARSIKPDYFVSVALCTHLGCIPTFRPEPGSVQPDWPGGFYCPCHGSKFDLAGRVFKGVPAPSNLVVPPYEYVGAQRILIGKHGG
jgi:ubiquinol-cytochrome c reductase iron-sulfur subunit